MHGLGRHGDAVDGERRRAGLKNLKSVERECGVLATSALEEQAGTEAEGGDHGESDRLELRAGGPG